MRSKAEKWLELLNLAFAEEYDFLEVFKNQEIDEESFSKDEFHFEDFLKLLKMLAKIALGYDTDHSDPAF